MSELSTLMSGLAIGESPRWRDGRLWFSDMGAQEVIAVDLAGNSELIARVPGMPMGLGWLPGGAMLIVSSMDGKLMRREEDGTLATQADLNGLSPHAWSDMVVDGRGNAYIGNIGFDFAEGFDGQEGQVGTVALITPDGQARKVANELGFPNGMAVTPDNATLIVAESYTNRLTAFDIAADGTLSNQRVWAQLGDGVPDGICLDVEGAVWYADVPNKCCIRVREGGAVLQRIDLDRGAFACALGGEGGQTLFITAASWPECMNGDVRTGIVLSAPAPAAGAGSP